MTIAFLAGLATFLTYCVLPLVPAYVGDLGGQYARTVGEEHLQHSRRLIVLHALAFISGFPLVLLFFNIVAAAIGLLLGSVRTVMARMGGLIVLIFGLHTTGLLRLHTMPRREGVSLFGVHGCRFLGWLVALRWAHPGSNPDFGHVHFFVVARHLAGPRLFVRVGASFSASCCRPWRSHTSLATLPPLFTWG